MTSFFGSWSVSVGGASKGAAVVHFSPNCFGACTSAVFGFVTCMVIWHANYRTTRSVSVCCYYCTLAELHTDLFGRHA